MSRKKALSLAESNLKDRLAAVLAKLPSVRQFDLPDEPQAWTMVYSLTDIEESCAVLLDTLLPKLLKQNSPKQAEETLWEIGEELRHILYHIRDMRYFESLVNRVDPRTSHKIAKPPAIS